MKKIMLVDDTPVSNFIMSKAIQAHLPNSQVVAYSDPEEAYDNIKIENPDLIFLDLNMPIMDGWEFLEKMKENGLHVKVAILSASCNTSDLRKWQSYQNVVNFCIKPITADLLIETAGMNLGYYVAV
tara:strand:- start:683 stop:1063 length:381 start_codon:yes stop_codon:yes gene_type:complete